MTAVLDTNVVVRYLAGEPQALADRAAEIIDSDLALAVTDIVITESAYVLTRVYGADRAAVMAALTDLVQRKNISVIGLSKELVIQALRMAGPSGRVSLADGMIWASATGAGSDAIYTFDRRFPREGIEVREP